MKDADLDGCPDPENGEERYGVCQLKNVERGRSEAVMSSTERACEIVDKIRGHHEWPSELCARPYY